MQRSKLKRKATFIFLFLFLFFTIRSSVFAVASIGLSDSSTDSLSDPNQEFQVKVKLMINTPDGTNYYLRGVFYKEGEGPSKYCGFTWNGTEWFSGPYSTDERWKKFLSVTIASDSAQTTLKAKLDITDSGCKESGTYKFKVQRFTQSGNGTFDGQNEQTLQIRIPTSVPTATPSIRASPTQKPSSTPTRVTPTGTGVKIQNTSTIAIQTESTLPESKVNKNTDTDLGETISQKFHDSSGASLLLGESTAPGEQNPERTVIHSTNDYRPITLFLSLGGLLFIACGVFMVIKKMKRKKSTTK